MVRAHLNTQLIVFVFNKKKRLRQNNASSPIHSRGLHASEEILQYHSDAASSHRRDLSGQARVLREGLASRRPLRLSDWPRQGARERGHAHHLLHDGRAAGEADRPAGPGELQQVHAHHFGRGARARLGDGLCAPDHKDPESEELER